MTNFRYLIKIRFNTSQAILDQVSLATNIILMKIKVTLLLRTSDNYEQGSWNSLQDEVVKKINQQHKQTKVTITEDGSCDISKTALIMVTGCWDKMFSRDLAHLFITVSFPTSPKKMIFPQTALRNRWAYHFSTTSVLSQQPTHELKWVNPKTESPRKQYKNKDLFII